MTTPAMNIVVGIALDDSDEPAFTLAADLARASGAQLHIAYACGLPSGEAEEDARALERGEQYLGGWAVAKLASDPLIRQCHLYVDLGDPAEVLRRLVADRDARMLVVGHHRRGAIAKWVEPSVVSDLLAKPPCPVLIASEGPPAPAEKLPHVEAPHAPGDARPHVRPHALHYRRTIRLNRR